MKRLKDELFSINGTTSKMCEEILKWTQGLPIRIIDVPNIHVEIRDGVITVKKAG